MTYPMPSAPSLLRRSLVALAACFTLTVGVESASAIPDPRPPFREATKTHDEFAKANSDFKAGFEVSNRIRSFDYETICAWAGSTKAVAQCNDLSESETDVTYCLNNLNLFRARYCGIKGQYHGANVKGAATATLLKKSVDLLALEGWAIADYNEFRAGIKMSAAGKKIFSYERKSGWVVDWFVYQTLFSASRTIWVGPVPLYAEAEAVGHLGIGVQGTVGTSQLDTVITPQAGIEVEVGCGVGVDFAKAGAKGSFNLVTLSLPATGYLNWADFPSDRTLDYGGDINFRVDALDGEITLGAWLMGKEIASYPLVKWPGVTWSTKKNKSLYAFSGSLKL